jgi:hypothetical protein
MSVPRPHHAHADASRSGIHTVFRHACKLGLEGIVSRCGLLMDRINEELSTIKPNHLGNVLALIVQGALERAAALLRKM